MRHAARPSWKQQAWEQGLLVHNVNRSRPDKPPVFIRTVKDRNPQRLPYSGRSVRWPCLFGGRVG